MASAAVEEKTLESDLNISEEELKALEAVLFGDEIGKPEGVHTTVELAEMFGISETGMRKRIREALKNGSMEKVRFVDMDSTGRRQPRIGYRRVEDG